MGAAAFSVGPFSQVSKKEDFEKAEQVVANFKSYWQELTVDSERSIAAND